MTCEELHVYFEELPHLEAEFPVATEHLVHCAECAQFVEAQRGLGADLRLMRKSVPRLPASLDAAVLADYRRQVTAGELPARSSTHGRRGHLILSWSAAAAAIMLVAALLFFSERKAVTGVDRTHTANLSTGLQPVADHDTAVIPQTANHREAHPVRRKHRAPSIAMLEKPASAGFRSLMYCDALSCGGAMEVIRVELPSSAIALAGTARSANGPVLADVIVGPDGIARGIRIVE
ncbi:MAG: hypothetical protein WCC24_02235 [Terracidiphilus sp.]